MSWGIQSCSWRANILQSLAPTDLPGTSSTSKDLDYQAYLGLFMVGANLYWIVPPEA